MVWSPGLNYSSEETLDRQRERAKNSRYSPTMGEYIDADYVDVSATGDVRLLEDHSNEYRDNEQK